MYEDEVDIHLNPKIGPDWMLQGQQKEVLTPGQNQKRYLAGALDARTGKLTWIEGERKNSTLFLLLIHRLVTVSYRNARRIHIILDNFKIHDSRQVQLALAAWEGKVQLHFLPPYCPDHNRIERIWKDLHDNVTRNHCCKTWRNSWPTSTATSVVEDDEESTAIPKGRVLEEYSPRITKGYLA